MVFPDLPSFIVNNVHPLDRECLPEIPQSAIKTEAKESSLFYFNSSGSVELGLQGSSNVDLKDKMVLASERPPRLPEDLEHCSMVAYQHLLLAVSCYNKR